MQNIVEQRTLMINELTYAMHPEKKKYEMLFGTTHFNEERQGYPIWKWGFLIQCMESNPLTART